MADTQTNGVVLGKLNVLDETLSELRSLVPVSRADLEADWKVRRAIERDLQILVEVVVDVCQRLIAINGQSPAGTSAAAVQACVQLGVLSDRDEYRKMVQFRNLLVHRYERVNPEVLVDIVNNRLADIEKFRDEVLAYERSRTGHPGAD
ncbi:MAG: hypothetical protein A3K19_09080 [Lentisphaerae bacterium RIFOXYB12_FULL_65_16]|nr:MAG: hypothetical protein A3K18_14105 [Lentisphaerae bacterium RIFOXYA12_64_32]OGV93252.1 MAG: hypothetical protein A3K19_09080 [Lentisphaerae bacterium RIFOXYB12_FULL_65_16]